MRLPRPGLTTQILVALAVAVLFGWLAPGPARAVKLLGDIFIRLVLMIVAPLVFSMLAVGIARSGDFRKVGRLGLKTLAVFLIASTLAIVVGLAVALLLRPGAGANLSAAGPAPEQFLARPEASAAAGSFLLRLVPTSIVDAMARDDILQIVVFSVLFGLALLAVGERGRPIQALLESLAAVMFRFTDYVMYFAPLGVFGALAAIVGTQGIGVLRSFAVFIGGVVAAQAILLLAVFLLLVRAAGLRFWPLFRAIREAFLIALSTTSSGAALPKALEALEGYGVRRETVAFVLPVGLTFNLDGSHLHLAFSALFLAQAYGVPIGWGMLLVLVLLIHITAKGIPTIPRGTLLVLTTTVAPLGVPLDGIAVLLAVDQIPDMARTAMNLTANCLAAAVVDRWEKPAKTPAVSSPGSQVPGADCDAAA